LAIAIGVVNVLMIIGTLPEGGHHLIDVIVGAGVGLTSILVVRAINLMTGNLMARNLSPRRYAPWSLKSSA
jgi:membrane-associated phospholipid phosphatase